MRLDLQCNGIKHIVSHLWELRIWLIKALTCPAGKLIKDIAYIEEDLQGFFRLLVKRTFPQAFSFFKFHGDAVIDLLCCIMLRARKQRSRRKKEVIIVRSKALI